MTMAARLRTAGAGVVAGLVLLVASPAGGEKSSAGEPKMPAAAEKAIKRGLRAVKDEEWKLALHYFNEAQKKAPGHPRTIYYTALTHDKAGGRELLGIAWFRAYLALAPHAPIADKIRARIKELERGAQKTAQKLVGIAIASARQLPSKYSRNYRLADAAGRLAQVGDIAGATKLADELKSDSAYRAIAVAQAKAGDWAGAETTINAIKSNSTQSYAYQDMAKLKTAAGKYPAARKYTDLIIEDGYKVDSYLRIAGEQIKKGDKEGAPGTLALCKQVLERLKNGSSKLSKYRSFVALQTLAGDVDEALSIVSGRNAASRPALYASIAGAQFKMKNARAARATLEKVAATHRDSAFGLLARDRLKAGDIAGALRAIPRMSSEYGMANMYEDVMEAQIEAGDLRGAAQTAKTMPSGKYTTDDKADVYLKLAKAYREAKDRRKMKETILELLALLPKLNSSEKLSFRVKVAEFWLEAEERGEAQRQLEQAMMVLARMRAAKGFSASSFSGPSRLLAQLGRFNEAIEMVRKIKDDYTRDSARSAICKEMVKAGRYREALPIAAQIDKYYRRDSLVKQCLVALGKSGRLRRPERIMAAVKKDVEKQRIYKFLAAAQTMGGDAKGAAKTIALISSDKDRESLYLDLCAYRAWIGDAPGAISTLGLIRDAAARKTAARSASSVAGSVGDRDGSAKILAGGQPGAPLDPTVLGGRLLQDGKLSEARLAYQRAKREAAGLTEAGRIFDVHRSLAYAFRNTGGRLGADDALHKLRWGASLRSGDWDYYHVGSLETSLGDLRGAAKSLPLSKYGSYVRTSLCHAWLAAGMPDQALRLVPGMKTPRGRINSYCSIAKGQLSFGDRSRAQATLRLAVKEAADGSKINKYYRDSVRGTLASALLKAGERAAAGRQFELIKSKSNRRSTSLVLARICAEQGDAKSAERYVILAEQLAAKESESTRFSTYLGLARILHLTGDGNRARRALAAAVKMLAKLETSGSYSPPEGKLAAVQALLGDARRGRKSAESIYDLRKKYRALVGVGKAQAESGDLKGALKTLAYAEKYRVGRAARVAPPRLVSQVVSHLVARKKIEEAKIAAAGIVDAKIKANAYGVIMAAELKAKKFKAAMSTAGDIPAGSIAAFRAWHLIAKSALARGDASAAKSACANIADSGFKTWTLIDIAQYQARKGDYESAAKTAPELPGLEARSLAYVLIAEEQAAVGKGDGAKASLKLARSAAEGVKPAYARARALARVGHGLREAGVAAGAKEVMAAAEAAASAVAEEARRAWARRAIKSSRPQPVAAAAGAEIAKRDKELREFRKKEFGAWQSRIKYNMNKDIYKDPAGFMRALKAKNKSAEDAVSSILRNVGYMRDELEKLQSMEMEWAAKRKAAAGVGKKQ